MFSTIIDFLKSKRTILASAFLVIGILSSTLTVIIAFQRPQIIRSRASETHAEGASLVEYKSAVGNYQLIYDQRFWQRSDQEDQVFGSRAVLKLNQEYGLARIDIIEGQSDQNLEILASQIIKKTSPAILVSSQQVQFKGKVSLLNNYTEKVVGQDVSFSQQIIKDENTFIVLEKRAPQLGYNQAYMENLLEGFSFKNSLFSPQVKGVSDISSDLTTIELVDLVRPSVASIVYLYCLDIVNLQPAVTGMLAPKYSFCGLSKGSGFLVNEKGYLATNGHVAKIFAEEGLVNNLLNEGNKQFAFDLIQSVFSSVGQTLATNQLEDFHRQLNNNPHYLDRFVSQIFDLINKKAIDLSLSNERYFVNVGESPVKIDYQMLGRDPAKAIVPSATTYTASLVDLNYPNKYSYEAIVKGKYIRGADVALLKINNISATFPAVELGSIESLREGSEIVVIGYPTLVEGSDDPRSAISYKSSTRPTITRGIISAVKEDVTGEKILQTDASIDHGNSGGPAFNSDGQIIGIATFLAESKSGNFNFLRDVDELKKLMSKNKIDNKLGDLTQLWRKGLGNFRNKHYNQAINDFKQVESISPSHPTVKELIALSEEGIKEGKSLEGLIGFIRAGQSSYFLVIFGSVAIVSFILSGFLMILPLFRQE